MWNLNYRVFHLSWLLHWTSLWFFLICLWSFDFLIEDLNFASYCYCALFYLVGVCESLIIMFFMIIDYFIELHRGAFHIVGEKLKIVFDNWIFRLLDHNFASYCCFAFYVWFLFFLGLCLYLIDLIRIA